MRSKLAYVGLIALVFIAASACRLLAQGTTPAATTSTPVIVQPTLPPTASPTAAPTATQEPTPEPTAPAPTGSLRGKLGYPADAMPAMHIVAFLFGTDTYFAVDTEASQMDYQLDGLLAGNYHVVAYTKSGGGFPAGLSGGYTQAAKCGMGETCTDHTLVDVAVGAGEVVENVNLTDWLVPLPPMPQPGGPVMGAITGKLSYPSEFIPPTRVVAFRLSDGQTFFVDTQMNEGQYSLPAPAGTYHVVAYAGKDEMSPGVPGGYSRAVPCGLSVDCTDHSLIDVFVVQGSVTYGADPGDFYAPEGAFPPAP